MTRNVLKEYWDMILLAGLVLIWGVRLEGRVDRTEEKANEVKEIRTAVQVIREDVAVIKSKVAP